MAAHGDLLHMTFSARRGLPRRTSTIYFPAPQDTIRLGPAEEINF